MGNSVDKNANKISRTTSLKSSNIPAHQCSTSIQTFTYPVQLSNTRLESSNTIAQSHNATVKPPKPFITEEEFQQTWPLWKHDFVIYKKIVNNDKPNNRMCASSLVNTMGPIGQEIFKTFTFNSLDDKNNLDVILKKFDEYHAIASIKKLNEEDIFMYIHHLQLKAQEANVANVQQLIRSKILKEINERMFTDAAKQVLPSFKFSSDFNNLTLKEIAFIWKLYDCKQFCKRCGNDHSNDSCPAMGQQCSKCNEWNHSRKRCPIVFIHDCKYCRNSHFKGKCPAYNEICTKCKKLNHFSWSCLSARILRCDYCGSTHGASKLLCPAKDAVCTYCKRTGHFAAVCKKKASSKNH